MKAFGDGRASTNTIIVFTTHNGAGDVHHLSLTAALPSSRVES